MTLKDFDFTEEDIFNITINSIERRKQRNRAATAPAEPEQPIDLQGRMRELLANRSGRTDTRRNGTGNLPTLR